MENLFELLAGTNNMVTIDITVAGFTMTQNVHIVGSNKFLDGLELYTENEGKFFISSIASEVVEETHDGYIDSYALKAATGALITITIDGER